MEATVSAESVVPMQVAIAVAGISGIIAFPFFLKDSIVYFNERGAEAIDESAVRCGCISLVHTFAITNYIFWIVAALDGLFVSNWLLPQQTQNCRVFTVVGSLGWVGCKAAQYGFFITRAKLVFSQTRWAIPQRFITRLTIVAVLFIISNISVGIFSNSEAYPRNASAPSTTSATTVNSYQVCISFEKEFSIISIWGGMTFVLCDSVIMFSVAYMFIRRLLAICQDAPNFLNGESPEPDKLDLPAVRQAGFYFAGFCVVAGISTYVTAALVNAYPDNLTPTFITLLDLLLNLGIVVVSLTDRFKLAWLLRNRATWSGGFVVDVNDKSDKNEILLTQISSVSSRQEMNEFGAAT